MSTGTEGVDRDLVWVATPCASPEPAIVRAATRAGALGVLDVGNDRRRALDALTATEAVALGTFGVRICESVELGPHDLPATVDTAILAVDSIDDHWLEWAADTLDDSRRLIAEVVSEHEARSAIDAGVHGIVAKGCESAGRVGTTGAFVLLQQVLAAVEDHDVPVWVQGGIGVHTVGAALVVGARGVVVDSQVALLAESTLGSDVADAIAAMDGTETRVIAEHRVYHRPDLWTAGDDMSAIEEVQLVARFQRATLRGPVAVAIGQDGAFASTFARRWRTTGRAVDGLRRAANTHIDDALSRTLVPDDDHAALPSALPVAQGPMTRVSDQPEFAACVAAAGGLPFLALALLSGDDTRSLLTTTRERLGSAHWGVGVLGFAPRELRDVQLAAVREARPSAVIIAGGRPSQAAPLEADGIATYLHVPGPQLLARFVRDGARRFVFEGYECGGHIGPRSSFVLWESQVEVLLEQKSLEGFEVLFAGGIHDGPSAAAVRTLATPLVERGASVGILMGTAYLFTVEAVRSGAIGSVFQEQALACDRTSVLESGPGHVTRCATSPFVELFEQTRGELVANGRPHNEVWAELESLNLGRLRLASKGVRREGEQLVDVDEDEQRADGLFMIGDTATLHDELVTIEELHEVVTGGAQRWLADVATRRRHDRLRGTPSVEVAIVGMAAIMPQAHDVEAFWSNILDGVDCVTEVSPERWNVEHGYNADYTHEGAARDPRVESASKWGGFIPAVEFDALAYGIPPASLAATEPGQLLALKVATDALVDAGYAVDDPEADLPRTRTAVVFASGGGTDQALAYSLRCSLPGLVGHLPAQLDEYLPVVTEDSFPGMLTSVIAGRVANRLDLGGKNLTVDAACASSLAAADVACSELTLGNADMVLCGSVDLHNGLHDYQFFTSVHALSPTGRSRTFDRSADGIALGEGVACLVLKRLDDARRDGDRVYAVINSIAGASDGRHLGLTAPRQEGQQRALRRAYASCDVDPGEVGLVEAHGTGTIVGDRTELRALNDVFGVAEPGSIALGSVKSNIGHTKCSAGLAGLIKAAKAIYHAVLPPTLHIDEPNDALDIETGPFRILDRSRPWVARRRMAAVSAFGFGGTNFHAVLSAPTDTPSPPAGRDHWPSELIVLRGDDDEVDRALMELHTRLGEGPRLETHSDLRLRDIAAAFAASEGPARLAIVADTLEDLRAKVAAAADGQVVPGVIRSAPGETPNVGEVAMMFPGQGSQRIGMLADLAVAFGERRDVIEAGAPWLEAMMPGATFDSGAARRQRDALTDTRVAQPALAIADMYMLALLEAVGVEPDVVAGHSFGELAALCAAQAFDFTTLLELASARAAAILDAAGDDPGSMLAVAASRGDVATIAESSGVVVANDNHPGQVVLAGAIPAIEEAERRCREHSLTVKRLDVACAFHSPVVAPAVRPFEEALEQSDVSVPRIPVFSNTTAQPYPHERDGVTQLLAGQIGSEVRFTDEIRAMHAAGVGTFIEVGPGSALTSMVNSTLAGTPHLAVATDQPGLHGVTAFLHALARLTVHGVEVDVEALHRHRDSDARRWTDPIERAGWTVNGHLVRRTDDGTTLPGGLRPADEMPAMHMSEADERSQGLEEGVAPDVGTGPGGHIVDDSNQRETERPNRADPPEETHASDRARGSGADGVMFRYFDTVDRINRSAEESLRRYLGNSPDGPTPEGPQAAPPVEVESRAALPAPDPTPAMQPSTANGSLAPAPATNGVAAPAEHGPATNGHAAPTTVAVVSAPPSTVNDAIRRPEALLGMLVDVVARRTGYPTDLLDPDMDLEADLSIDSIKRLEVLGELADELGIDDGDLEDMDDLMEELAAQKTLRTIVAFLVAQADRLDPPDGDPPAGPGPPVGTGPHTQLDAGPPAVEVGVSGAGPVEPTQDTPTPDIHIVGSSRAEARVGEAGVVAAIPAHPLHYEVTLRDLADAPPRPLGSTSIAVSGTGPVAHAIVAALAERGVDTRNIAPLADDTDLDGDIVVMCDLLDVAAPQPAELFVALRTVRDRSPAEVIVVTGLGGGLGIDPPAPTSPHDPVPTSAGIRALVKTFRLEHPEIAFRIVDVDPCEPPSTVAARLAEEIGSADTPTEVARGGGARRVQALRHLPRPAGSDREIDLSTVGIDRDSVVLVTGGARGVTASLSIGIAARSGCRIELVGRSPRPDDHEPPELAACADRMALRRFLAREGGLDLPTIESRVDRILADREIRATLAELASTASSVGYHSVDVRDATALTAVVDDIRRRHGHLDAIVHGAGIGINKLIDDKTVDDFRAHFDTKVDALRTLLAATGGDLRVLIVFGSLVGPLGNRGQVDYAAANDALDAVVVANRDRIERALIVDWGPWNARTGMMSDELARIMESGGFGSLEPADAVRALLTELVAGDTTQVVIARAAPATLGCEAATPTWPSSPRVERRTFCIEDFPETLDHCIVRQRDGTDLRDRLPAVAMTRQIALFAEIAMGCDLERDVVSVEQVRNFRWLDVSETPEVEISVAPVADNALRIALGEHSKARVVMGTREPGALRSSRTSAAMRSARYSAAELFSQHLMFHGPRFQGITRIGPLDEQGIFMELEHLPTPGATLDNVGKAVGYWAMEERDWGDKALPVGVDEVRFHGEDPRPGERLDLEVEITRSATNEVRADAWITRADGRLWCAISGWRTLVMHLEPREEEMSRWPERTLLFDLAPGGLNRWADHASTTMEREFAARRLLDHAARREYESLPPRDARTFLCERAAATGALRGTVLPRDLEIYPNEVHFETVRPGLLLARCDLLPEAAWQVAVAATTDVGVAVVTTGATGDEPVVAVRVAECGDEDPSTVAAAMAGEVRAVVPSAEICTHVDESFSPSGATLAVAFTPTAP